jgi:hypothetical protein
MEVVRLATPLSLGWPEIGAPCASYLSRLVVFSAAESVRGGRAHPFVDRGRLAAPFEVGARVGGLAVIHEVKAHDELGVGTLRLGNRREDLFHAFDVECAIAFLE